jgi:hypothetical protein
MSSFAPFAQPQALQQPGALQPQTQQQDPLAQELMKLLAERSRGTTSTAPQLMPQQQPAGTQSELAQQMWRRQRDQQAARNFRGVSEFATMPTAQGAMANMFEQSWGSGLYNSRRPKPQYAAPLNPQEYAQYMSQNRAAPQAQQMGAEAATMPNAVTGASATPSTSRRQQPKFVGSTTPGMGT